MELFVIVLLLTVCNMLCLIIGVKEGIKASRGEEVMLPNPVRAVREHKEQKEASRKDQAMEDMSYNIDIYDGTGLGQRDISI